MLEQRIAKLREALPVGWQAALIGTEEDRFYLLDFDAPEAGTLLVLPGRMVYIVDSRYIELARRVVRGAEVILEDDVPAQLAAQLEKAAVSRVYLEDKIPVASWTRLKSKIPNVEFDISDTLSKTLANLRQVKDAEELSRMREAQRVTDACFEHILPYIKPGVREVELALEMEHYMRSHGAEKAAFSTICIAGANTSLPHGVPGENKVQKGDFVTMDFGAGVKGYCADMTRTVACGEPGEEKRKVYGIVLEAHLAGIEAVAAGKTGVEVDKAARDIIRDAGYGEYFGHGLGHGLGIEVHEEPRFSPRFPGMVPAGAVMSVEPGIYLPGRFGVRIEDAVIVKEGGCEPLPKCEKELIVL